MAFDDDDLSLKHLFGDMITYEMKAAQFYDQLSHKFDDTEEISSFWMQMRDDEFTHASILRATAEKINSEQLSSPVGSDIWDKLDSVRRLIDGEGLVDSVNDFRSAYELAHRIETSEINTIFSFQLSASEDGAIRGPEKIGCTTG